MKRSVSFTGSLVVGLLAGCTALTRVDWSRIPAQEATGGTTATSSGGENPGGAPSNEGGSPGAAGAGAGAGGETEGGEGGEGGTLPSGGVAGGGSGGGGSGNIGGNGGMVGGGNGGMGGVGGNNSVAPKCNTYPPVPASINLTGKIVMFDGGAQAAGVDWGGRAGLDAKCQAAATAQGLNKPEVHAFLSATTTDVLTPGYMANYIELFGVPTEPAVVSPLGITISANASEITNFKLSLICAGVVHEDVDAWFTGVKDGGASDPLMSCEGWTLRKEDLNNRAAVGLTDTTNTLFHDHLLADHWVSCINTTAHVLCLGWGN